MELNNNIEITLNDLKEPFDNNIDNLKETINNVLDNVKEESDFIFNSLEDKKDTDKPANFIFINNEESKDNEFDNTRILNDIIIPNVENNKTRYCICSLLLKCLSKRRTDIDR